MTKKKDKRGRKALPPEQKKPPQPTIKINPVLHPFVKLLKKHYKTGHVDAEKLTALTTLLLDGVTETVIEEQAALTPDELTEMHRESKPEEKDG
ncbi:MAG: hypothetical protein PHH59_06210 [Methylovulum sp.]|uniref:hypothetical protein n=1 Tax=Methylovulum sp. TaxID=1916980 RepID=UPI002622C520|nr:hypothetical protein [Methylovulum sp.]MDD2723598.1 hypothetical protein [Methylovulum sp.]MDD5125500.1 hypothetical protein [Methylovulum sp.]